MDLLDGFTNLLDVFNRNFFLSQRHNKCSKLYFFSPPKISPLIVWFALTFIICNTLCAMHLLERLVISTKSSLIVSLKGLSLSDVAESLGLWKVGTLICIYEGDCVLGVRFYPADMQIPFDWLIEFCMLHFIKGS